MVSLLNKGVLIVALGAAIVPGIIQGDTTQTSSQQNSTAASVNPDLQASIASAEKWLKLSDQQSYGESWDQASTLLKVTMKKDEWEQVMNATRGALGSVAKREIVDQRVATNPKGLPPGDYMVLFYRTEFQGGKTAYELLTLFKEDGQWRVMTYQVT